MGKIFISGFADEISPDFDEQLRVVTELGMKYISLRTADKRELPTIQQRRSAKSFFQGWKKQE